MRSGQGGYAVGQRVIVAVVAIVLALAGCSEDPQAGAPPAPEAALGTGTAKPTEDAAVTSEAVASDAVAPSEPAADAGSSVTVDATVPEPTLRIGEPPTMPTEALDQTQEGAEAFAEHYLESLSWAYQTQLVGYVASLGAASCASCDGLVDGARAMGRPEGLVRVLGVEGSVTGDQAVVEASVERLDREESEPREMVLRLGWIGVWLVEDVSYAD